MTKNSKRAKDKTPLSVSVNRNDNRGPVHRTEDTSEDDPVQPLVPTQHRRVRLRSVAMVFLIFPVAGLLVFVGAYNFIPKDWIVWITRSPLPYVSLYFSVVLFLCLGVFGLDLLKEIIEKSIQRQMQLSLVMIMGLSAVIVLSMPYFQKCSAPIIEFGVTYSNQQQVLKPEQTVFVLLGDHFDIQAFNAREKNEPLDCTWFTPDKQIEITDPLRCETTVIVPKRKKISLIALETRVHYFQCNIRSADVLLININPDIKAGQP